MKSRFECKMAVGKLVSFISYDGREEIVGKCVRFIDETSSFGVLVDSVKVYYLNSQGERVDKGIDVPSSFIWTYHENQAGEVATIFSKECFFLEDDIVARQKRLSQVKGSKHELYSMPWDGKGSRWHVNEDIDKYLKSHETSQNTVNKPTPKVEKPKVNPLDSKDYTEGKSVEELKKDSKKKIEGIVPTEDEAKPLDSNDYLAGNDSNDLKNKSKDKMNNI